MNSCVRRDFCFFWDFIRSGRALIRVEYFAVTRRLAELVPTLPCDGSGVESTGRADKVGKCQFSGRQTHIMPAGNDDVPSYEGVEFG